MVNGEGDTVTLSYEEYKNMKARIELLEVLAGAEDDVENGRVAPISETFDDLRKMKMLFWEVNIKMDIRILRYFLTVAKEQNIL